MVPPVRLALSTVGNYVRETREPGQTLRSLRRIPHIRHRRAARPTSDQAVGLVSCTLTCFTLEGSDVGHPSRTQRGNGMGRFFQAATRNCRTEWNVPGGSDRRFSSHDRRWRPQRRDLACPPSGGSRSASSLDSRAALPSLASEAWTTLQWQRWLDRPQRVTDVPNEYTILPNRSSWRKLYP
jgi:hypothetical protein